MKATKSEKRREIKVEGAL